MSSNAWATLIGYATLAIMGAISVVVLQFWVGEQILDTVIGIF